MDCDFEPSCEELSFCSLSVAYNLLPTMAALTANRNGARSPRTLPFSASGCARLSPRGLVEYLGVTKIRAQHTLLTALLVILPVAKLQHVVNILNLAPSIFMTYSQTTPIF